MIWVYRIIFKLNSFLLNLISHIYVPKFMRKWIWHKVGKLLGLKEHDFKEIQAPLTEFKNFESFFIRKIDIQKRLEDIKDNYFISPADGVLREIIKIPPKTNFIPTIKGKQYSIFELLGDDIEYGKTFLGGIYLNFYLSPSNYHRFHAPFNMIINEANFIDGWKLPVNDWSINKGWPVLAKNKRIILKSELVLNNNVKVPFAYIPIGASGVGKIVITQKPKKVLKTGEEVGYFSLGSTIIILLPPIIYDYIDKNSLVFSKSFNKQVKIGELILKFQRN